MSIPLSILDLAQVGDGESVADALHGSVELASLAEDHGYRRIWYAEHHNMSRIASAATSVLVAHVAAHTSTIRLGSGGVMLPNHSPLTIAEQFGTLAELHPGRIDLGLGRAPGGDQQTSRALRRDPSAADRFGDDVVELQGYLADDSRIAGVHATPGRGTHVPITILGSSLFGAQLAASLGLPYAFASHFAPAALTDAVAVYRERFRPSAQLSEPWVIAGAGVIVSEDADDARAQFRQAVRQRIRFLFGRGRHLGEEELDLLEPSQAGDQVRSMMRHTQVGTADEVRDQLASFATYADADELILASAARDRRAQLTTFDLLAGGGAELSSSDDHQVDERGRALVP